LLLVISISELILLIENNNFAHFAKVCKLALISDGNIMDNFSLLGTGGCNTLNYFRKGGRVCPQFGFKSDQFSWPHHNHNFRKLNSLLNNLSLFKEQFTFSYLIQTIFAVGKIAKINTLLFFSLFLSRHSLLRTNGGRSFESKCKENPLFFWKIYCSISS
jgi:hypothetical protein